MKSQFFDSINKGNNWIVYEDITTFGESEVYKHLNQKSMQDL